MELARSAFFVASCVVSTDIPVEIAMFGIR